MKKVILLVMLFSSAARADIVCQAETSMGKATIDITPDQITISGAALEEPVVYGKLDAQYDGHETDLITAPGLSLSYQNWYGCIHDAKITANFRTSPAFFEAVEVKQCAGGSTPDSLCRVPSP